MDVTILLWMWQTKNTKNALKTWSETSLWWLNIDIWQLLRSVQWKPLVKMFILKFTFALNCPFFHKFNPFRWIKYSQHDHNVYRYFDVISKYRIVILWTKCCIYIKRHKYKKHPLILFPLCQNILRGLMQHHNITGLWRLALLQSPAPFLACFFQTRV